jgi:transcriptional regulator with XRE-family HTH domain
MIGTNIKYLRRNSGLSQTKFAKLFNVNRGNIDSYERKIASPPIKVVKAIAEHYGLSVEAISFTELKQSSGQRSHSQNSLNLYVDIIKAKDDIINEQREMIRYLQKQNQILTQKLAKK